MVRLCICGVHDTTVAALRAPSFVAATDGASVYVCALLHVRGQCVAPYYRQRHKAIKTSGGVYFQNQLLSLAAMELAPYAAAVQQQRTMGSRPSSSCLGPGSRGACVLCAIGAQQEAIEQRHHFPVQCNIPTDIAEPQPAHTNHIAGTNSM